MVKNIKSTSLEEFYKEAEKFTGIHINKLLPPGINKEIGHFNIFDIAEQLNRRSEKRQCLITAGLIIR